jgi:hypothetical protein
VVLKWDIVLNSPFTFNIHTNQYFSVLKSFVRANRKFMRVHSSVSILPRLFLPLVEFVFFLGGCTVIYSPATPPIRVSTSTSTNIIAPSQTVIPSLAISKTKTFTTMPSYTSTFTLLPTPVGEDSQTKIAYLLRTNGNCSLPCWWGITPGRTTWRDAETYLADFALGISPPGSSQQDDLTIFQAEFPYPNSASQDHNLFALFSVNGNGIIEIVTSPLNTSVDSVLEINGVPSQIWIKIITNFGPGPLEYTLVLFYEKGIMVFYRGTTYPGNDGFIPICPQNVPQAFSQIWVWDSTTIHTFYDIGRLGQILDTSLPNQYRLLQEVSDVQSKDFYSTYINPLASQCIKTPWSDWFQ